MRAQILRIFLYFFFFDGFFFFLGGFFFPGPLLAMLRLLSTG